MNISRTIVQAPFDHDYRGPSRHRSTSTGQMAQTQLRKRSKPFVRKGYCVAEAGVQPGLEKITKGNHPFKKSSKNEYPGPQKTPALISDEFGSIQLGQRNTIHSKLTTRWSATASIARDYGDPIQEKGKRAGHRG